MQLKEKKLNGTTSEAITEREIKNREIARIAAAEGFVLLKNENDLLPVTTEKKIALYGAGANHTIKGGTGSGDVNERASVSIYQGMLNAGYQITTTDWIQAYDQEFDEAKLAWKNEIFAKVKTGKNFFEAYSATQFGYPCGETIDVEAAKADGADVAIYVLSRVAGENADRHEIEGDYLITAQEKALLAQICEAYKNVVLVVNTGGILDLGFVTEFDNIYSIIQFVQAGMEGGNAFADVFSGKVSPSGKMTDTWALSYNDYPNAKSFSHKSGDIWTEEYIEGIYVGYRYFDTFDVPVLYSFGHGLSYTTFDIALCENGITQNNDNINLKVKVTNTGATYSGKEVVQIYVSVPQDKLAKEYRRLVAFGKTKTLAPGESQELEITFKASLMTSYCQKCNQWILEKGIYGFFVGSSLANATLSCAINIEQDIVVEKCKEICKMQKELKEISPDKERLAKKRQEICDSAKELQNIVFDGSKIETIEVDYTDDLSTREGLAKELVENLSIEQLIELSTGEVAKGGMDALGASGSTVPGAAAETIPISTPVGEIAGIVLADGPAGLRLKSRYEVVDGKITPVNIMDALEHGYFSEPKEYVGTSYYQYCTAIPVGTLIAQTWDQELIYEVGKMIGTEMEYFNVTLWLAPGMNIHRNPLCGRNFEYFSEDPIVSGIMASAMTRGVQSVPGCGTTIKHYACNNQEDNRMGNDSIISQRALREIYLKGFEIAIKDSQPMSIMTSYNMINGKHTANSYDLCTMAARKEWGFEGMIMTDWTTTNCSTAGESTASGCMRAQNDIVMPGMEMDHEDIKKSLEDGTLSEEQLRRCVYNTIRIILQSNRYEDAVSYSKQFDTLGQFIVTK